jgi:hypothetical protein
MDLVDEIHGADTRTVRARFNPAWRGSADDEHG